MSRSLRITLPHSPPLEIQPSHRAVDGCDMYIIGSKFAHSRGYQHYLVYHRKTALPFVLVKLFGDNSGGMRNSTAAEEARKLQGLIHPNIVHIHKIITHCDRDFAMIVDYCDAGTIQDFIEKSRDSRVLIREDRIMLWLAQIVMALHYLHSNRVLHKDLRASNMLLHHKGFIVKVDKAGYAPFQQIFGMDGLNVGFEMQNMTQILSPELIENSPHTAACDMWALGVMLYEMCQLSYPFKGGNMTTMILSILKDTPTPINKCYSPQLRELVSALLCKSATDRPTIHDVIKLPLCQAALSELICKLCECVAADDGMAASTQPPHETDDVINYARSCLITTTDVTKPQMSVGGMMLPSPGSMTVSCDDSVSVSYEGSDSVCHTVKDDGVVRQPLPTVTEPSKTPFTLKPRARTHKPPCRLQPHRDDSISDDDDEGDDDGVALHVSAAVNQSTLTMTTTTTLTSQTPLQTTHSESSVEEVQEDECELHIADDANTNTDTDDSGEYDDDDFETVDTPTVTM